MAEVIPPKRIVTDYPLIDNDPHISRIVRYWRRSDYALIVGSTAVAPAIYASMEYFSPMYTGKDTFRTGMRLSTTVGLMGGFFWAYQRSSRRFWGWDENAREVEMDMREMVQKVKNKEPLYGVSALSPYMQGVAARNSRYSANLMHVWPWFNLANHNEHGVDTAKYYRQAERELEEERLRNA